MVDLKKLKKGSQNILINCANLCKSDRLLIISEDEKFGWYKNDIAKFIYNEASNLGIKTDFLIVGEPKNDNKNKLKTIVNKYDCTIFFARIGDQERFESKSFKTKRVMSYVKSNKSLISSFGCTNYNSMTQLKNIINNLIINSKNIEITCPLGTKISGKVTKNHIVETNDVSVLRFPVVVPAPILANQFSGKVVLKDYLTSTGSKVYKPDNIKLKETIIATLDKGKISNFIGNPRQVSKVKDHYNKISKLFNIDKNIVHSWHAGMHPGISYESTISKNPDRWSNTIFASPNYLHFHTCGDYAPGEICWMVSKPTVKLDGKPIWKDGILKINTFKETFDCVNKCEDLRTLYKC